MTANRSPAVMAQRAPAPDALDYFPTPPWATRALCEWLHRRRVILHIRRAWDPACGELHMARVLGEYFYEALASDVHQYGANEICDFLALKSYAPRTPVEWIITNPPFLLAEQFIATALDHALEGVAMLVRTSFLEGQDRYRNIFAGENRPSHVLQFSERVGMFKGRVIEVGKPDPFNLDDKGQPRSASTATSYCWLVWDSKAPAMRPTELHWIAPCRTQLERPGDYPAYSEQWAKIAPATGGLL